MKLKMKMKIMQSQLVCIYHCLSSVVTHSSFKDYVDDDNDKDDNEEEVLDGDNHVDITAPLQQVNVSASHESDDQTQGQGAPAEPCSHVFIEHFPLGSAGQPILNQGQPDADYNVYRCQFAGSDGASIYHPFASKMDWEVARWAKVHGITSTAVSELLGIEGVSLCWSFSL